MFLLAGPKRLWQGLVHSQVAFASGSRCLLLSGSAGTLAYAERCFHGRHLQFHHQGMPLVDGELLCNSLLPLPIKLPAQGFDGFIESRLDGTQGNF